MIKIRHKSSDEALKILKLGTPEHILDFIYLAFSCGGFLAGGFPRFFLGASAGYLTIDHPIWSESLLKMYITNGGDIDVFFRSPENHKKFVSLLTTGDGTQRNLFSVTATARSFAGFAVNIEISDKSMSFPKVKCQLINTVYGEPAEIISNFDFANSMVALDEKDFYVVENWENIEKQTSLHIVNSSSEVLINRVRKYAKKYGYQQFTPSSLEKLKANIETNIKKISNDQLQIKCSKSMFAYRIATLMRDSGHMFDSDTLLYFLSLFIALSPVNITLLTLSEIYKTANESKSNKNVVVKQFISTQIWEKIEASRKNNPAHQYGNIDVELEEFYDLLSNLDEEGIKKLINPISSSTRYILEEEK